MTALLATAALSMAAPDKDALMASEKAAWQAFKDKKADDFKKVVSADLVAVYAEGMMDMSKELSDMAKWDHCKFQKDQWGQKGLVPEMTRPPTRGAYRTGVPQHTGWTAGARRGRDDHAIC